MKNRIDAIWDQSEAQQQISSSERDTIIECLSLLNKGQIRVAEKSSDGWIVNEWIKKVILMSFKIYDMRVMDLGNKYRDKIPLKCNDWTDAQFTAAGFRIVPGTTLRYSAFVGSGCVLMPSFINMGAYIDSNTLIDTWATIGSCAQIGKNCHISGGAGIGGVLEPLQAAPVIIEDDVFIGARSEIVEGTIVERGSVISMGVYIGSSTKIYDRATGEIHFGRIPAYSVVVPGTLPSSDGKTHTYAAIIVKTVDAKTRSKVGINELLRAA